MQQPAESFATLDLAIDASDPRVRLLPEEDHAIQALTLQASHESFHVCIQIWRSCRKFHGVYISPFENRTERIAELRVAVHDQIPAAE